MADIGRGFLKGEVRGREIGTSSFGMVRVDGVGSRIVIWGSRFHGCDGTGTEDNGPCFESNNR